MRRITTSNEVYTLTNLVKKILSGRIRTGTFRPTQAEQTPLDRAAAASSLLNAINRGYPIGTIVLWDTDENHDTRPPLSARHGGGPRPTGMTSYIADGVARLTALVHTLTGAEPATAGAGATDPEVFYDLVSERFTSMPQGTERNALYMPATTFMETTEYMKTCEKVVKATSGKNDPERAARFLDRADNLSAALRDCQIPVIRIADGTLDDAIMVYKLTRSATSARNYS